MSKRGIAVAMIALNVDFYYKGTTKKSGGCTCIFNLATNQIYSQHIFRIGNKVKKQNVKYGHISSSVPKLWHLIMSMKV